MHNNASTTDRIYVAFEDRFRTLAWRDQHNNLSRACVARVKMLCMRLTCLIRHNTNLRECVDRPRRTTCPPQDSEGPQEVRR